MRIQPDEGIMLRFGAKVPGLGIDVRNVTMDFTYGSAFQTDSPDAYETLILDALLGDASLFTRADEVEQAWSIVDPIIADLGRGAGARLPQLRGRDLGPRGGRRPARPRGTTVAADLTARGGAAAARHRSSRSATRPTGGRIEPVGPARPGEPQLRWQSRANTIDDIEKELSRIWAQPPMVLDAGRRAAPAGRSRRGPA